MGRSSAEGIWRLCRRDPKVARLFTSVLMDPVWGGVLLVHPNELFPSLEVKSEKLCIPFVSRGLPYLSHRFENIRLGIELVLNEHATDTLRAERQRRVQKATGSLGVAAGEDVRDRFVVAALETIRRNSTLRKLVLEDETLDRSRLREAVKDYSNIDFFPLEDAFRDLLPFFRSRKQRKVIGGMARNLDDFLGSLQIEGLKADLVWRSAQHFQSVLRVRSVSEAAWRRLLLQLAFTQLVVPASPLYFWCIRGPDSAYSTSFSPVYFADPPACPLCGNIAQAICTFSPSGYLRRAMEYTDGVLAIAVGWFLRKHLVRFRAGLRVGGTELDFLVSANKGSILIECKMHYMLTSDNHIAAQLLTSRSQLRDHIQVATREGLGLWAAVCVVNLGARHLQRVLETLPAEGDPEYQQLGAEVISYEDFSSWVRKALRK